MALFSILIIGCGSIGERHLRCFLRSQRAAVTACDPNPTVLQRMATTYGVPTVPDADEALAGGFDAAVICTPASLHIPLAARALGLGRHVLIEKPLSHSFDGIEEFRRQAAESGRRVAVAYVFRMFPFLTAAKAFLQSGEFGPLLHGSVSSGQPFHLLRPAYAQTYYRDRNLGGGAIQDALTHAANWMESVAGPTESVSCDAAHLALPGVEVEDTVHLNARHGRIRINYMLNQFQAPNETTIQLNAARGSIKIELHRQRWGTFAYGDQDWTWREQPAEERDAHFFRQAGHFLDELEGKPSPLCSLEEAVQTLRFNLAALASAERGVRVSCTSGFTLPPPGVLVR